MAIFRKYLEDIWPKVPTLLRKKPDNIINLAVKVYCQAMDAVAEALEEYIDAWPIDTAPTWILDDHWLPYHGLQRNGLDDTTVRLYIHAKRLLNKSWGAGDQALEIFDMLLQGAATLSFSYLPPKAWVINIGGVDMATAAAAVKFMTKGPSPVGGGFSVCGDNGVAVTVDAAALNYSSIYGAVTVTGFYGSIYGVGGGAQAGHAHAVGI
jgi:hypothetical protein